LVDVELGAKIRILFGLAIDIYYYFSKDGKFFEETCGGVLSFL